MIIVIEIIVLCLIFTLMVYLMSRDPIKTLYNYPPKMLTINPVDLLSCLWYNWRKHNHVLIDQLLICK